MKKAWEERHDASLVDRLVSELSGDFEALALAILKGKRTTGDAADDEEVDEELAKVQAMKLAEGTGDLALYVRILCTHSPAQNSAIAEAHEMIYNRSLAKRCLLYTSPSPRDGLLSRMPSSA